MSSGQRFKRGLLISLEGPEGAGKSTHGRRLAAWLKRLGYSVLFTREPGGTPVGRRLRRLLLDSSEALNLLSKRVQPLVELCLYEASRAALVTEVIQPALAQGRIVVLDRFQDSTWVYQGWAGGIDPKWVKGLGRLATGGLTPDLTILLDLPVASGLARVKRPNRMEAKPLWFHRKIRQGYLCLARQEPARFRVIRADRPVRRVALDIREAVKDVLEKHRRA